VSGNAILRKTPLKGTLAPARPGVYSGPARWWLVPDDSGPGRGSV